MSDNMVSEQAAEEQATPEQEQETAPKWTAQLPDDLKDNPEFQGMKTPGELAKEYLSLKEKTPKVPSDPKEYELDDEAFAKFAHDTGLTKEAAKKVKEHYDAQRQKEQEQRAKQDTEKAREVREQFKTEWGDKYDENLLVVKKALGEEALKELETDTVLGNNPALVRRLLYLGKAISEDRLSGAAGTAGEQSGDDFLKEVYPSMANMPERQ